MKHLAQFVRSINQHNDADGLKHRPLPPTELEYGQTLLFVYGEASDSRASIERRGWLRIQSSKLGTAVGTFMPKILARRAFESAVASQIERYKVFERSFPDAAKCIAYDELWSRAEDLSDFLQIRDPLFLREFPKKKERLSQN